MLVMKNVTRKRFFEMSILCLMVASSGRLFAQGTAKQSVKSIVEQPPGEPAAASHATPGTASEPQVRVGAGDLLEIRVFDTPELTQTTRISDLGDTSLNLIGRLHLGDLTPDEARDAIAHKLVDGHFLVNPQVSVLIQEYGTQGVSVLGEVQKPGVYSVLGNRSLLDVISQAGGTTMYAGSTVTVKRNSDSTLLTVPLTRNAKNTLTSDVRLQPGDKVFIPRASLVYVLGDVGRPGGFLMQNAGRMTVLQALALAGGQTRTASMDHTRLIHKTDSGYTDTQVSLKKIMNGHEPDTELQAEDILYIPNSVAKSLIYRTAPSIFQSASSAAIYGAIF
ncbi:MAG: polysaccharide biosynthesis/export protein [Candidatus Acidoferrum typicum]|nr:polysaccharide biosynthesis/export protein [Candidatus Acidoferrum typicum]